MELVNEKIQAQEQRGIGNRERCTLFKERRRGPGSYGKRGRGVKDWEIRG